MKTYVFEVELDQDEDGRWSATIPSLPGCSTWGMTKEEALESLREAAQAYLAVLLEEEGALPPDAVRGAHVVAAPAVAVTL